jgi:uncharacterized protein YqjF (DUF2071 family)
MLHRWDQVAFLHWPYPVGVVQALLPPGLTVEPFDGRSWVGLVPFSMEVRPPGGSRRRPWFSFPETNVRTYVSGPDRETGVWFFSLDAARLGPVLVARATYRVPYYWSQMTVAKVGALMSYRSRRRWPGRGDEQCEVDLELGERLRPEELTEFDHYLTARWRLFGTWGRRLLTARAEHDPWPLHRASVQGWRDDLVIAAGLPAPSGQPVVHWSPGVDVKVGFPEMSAPG